MAEAMAHATPPAVGDVPARRAMWEPIIGAASAARPIPTDVTTAELTEYTPGSSFAYQLTNFTNILSRLAAGARGEFNVNPDGDGTLIRWTYEFKPLPGRRWILAGPFTPLWRRYMAAALDRCVHVIETEKNSEPVPLRAS
ncbi:SRPBCC family protein [Streptomyces avermitilis]|uniref:SRPBCC family protein n=1 Tax=Streptomyces avermitilis TaxID=33903 RepID=UPI00380590DC